MIEPCQYSFPSFFLSLFTAFHHRAACCAMCAFPALHQHCHVRQHLAIRVHHLLCGAQVHRTKTKIEKKKENLRRDGRNESSRDTFRCHYNPSNPNITDQFVTIRYILTKPFLFLLHFWLFSCVKWCSILQSKGWQVLRFHCRFDLDGTKHFFLLAFTVPAAF